MANEINIYEPRYLAEAVRTAPPICSTRCACTSLVTMVRTLFTYLVFLMEILMRPFNFDR